MTFAFLRRWLRLAPKPRPDLHILVFTRAACPLCDEAWELLKRLQRRYGFALELKDIDESADLVRRIRRMDPSCDDQRPGAFSRDASARCCCGESWSIPRDRSLWCEFRAYKEGRKAGSDHPFFPYVSIVAQN